MTNNKRFAGAKNQKAKPTGNPMARPPIRPKKKLWIEDDDMDVEIVREPKPIKKFATPKPMPKGACPLFKKCGGCQLQNMTYKEQLEWKQNKVERLLNKFGKVSPIVGMENPLNYRNKVQAAFAMTREKKIISGVYQSSSHTVVPVDECMIEDKKADQIIVTIRNLAKDFKYIPYNERTGIGMLRHVLVKRGFASGQIMVVIVMSTPILPSKNNFVTALLKKHPEITTIVHNVNPYETSLVLGDNEKVLYGKGYIEDTLCGCIFRISARSFYQINPVQTEVLYNKAIELAGLTGKETVIDAYCGIGTIGLVASKHVKNVIGVELNRDAVKDAIYNCKRNEIENARFYQGDAGDFMSGMAQDSQTADVVFMDPPRAGSDEKFLSSVIALSPPRVVYISCNPDSLARDLEYITKHGYKVKAIHPVDMFPHTNHVETVCLLSKLKTNHHIEVNLNMDELDLTSAESKATYEEIKEYVLENSGLKVSSLYIGQVKEKMGIKERENYNISKKEDAKVPKCPADKEKAIIEAFKHFNMID